MMARVALAFIALILGSSLALAKSSVTDVRIGVHPDKRASNSRAIRQIG